MVTPVFIKRAGTTYGNVGLRLTPSRRSVPRSDGGTYPAVVKGKCLQR